MTENITRAAALSVQLGEAIARTAGDATADELAAAIAALSIATGRPVIVQDDEMSDLEELEDLADTALTNWEMAAAQRNIRREELQMARVRRDRAEREVEQAAAEYDRACARRDAARRADEGDPQMRDAAAAETHRFIFELWPPHASQDTLPLRSAEIWAATPQEARATALEQLANHGERVGWTVGAGQHSRALCCADRGGC